MRRIPVLFFLEGVCLVLAGCYLPMVTSVYLQSTDVFISPETLPDAKVGQPYYAEIEIIGGAPVNSFSSKVTPPDAFVIEPVVSGAVRYVGPNNGNLYRIHGTPRTLSDITVRVEGEIKGNGGEYDKTYTIRVIE